MQGQAGVRGSLIRHIRLPPRPMPPSWAQTIRPYTPRGTHWATCKPELPPNTRLLLAPSVHEAPWSSLKTEFQVRCCSRSIAPAGQRAGGACVKLTSSGPPRVAADGLCSQLQSSRGKRMHKSHHVRSYDCGALFPTATFG